MIIKYIAGPLIGAVIGYCTNFIAVKMLFYPKKEKYLFGHRLPFTPGAIPKGKSRLAKSVGEAVGNNLITSSDIENKLMSDEICGKVADMITDELSVTLDDVFGGLSELTGKDAESSKESVSENIAKYISGAISQVDISGIIVERATSVIREKLNNPMIQMFLTDELLKSVLTPISTEIQTYIAQNGEELIAPYVKQKLDDSGDKSITDVLEIVGLDETLLKKAIVILYRKAVSECLGKLIGFVDLGGIVEEKINAMSSDELEMLVMSVMKKEMNTIVNLGALIGFVLGLLNIFI